MIRAEWPQSPVGLRFLGENTQGSSCLATLGCGAKSRWDLCRPRDRAAERRWGCGVADFFVRTPRVALTSQSGPQGSKGGRAEGGPAPWRAAWRQPGSAELEGGLGFEALFVVARVGELEGLVLREGQGAVFPR